MGRWVGLGRDIGRYIAATVAYQTYKKRKREIKTPWET